VKAYHDFDDSSRTILVTLALHTDEVFGTHCLIFLGTRKFRFRRDAAMWRVLIDSGRKLA
jgi:hypothetical protein